ncbi:hypothetical protein [Psychromonas sp. Urea-02u-13]|uniref:hypothetical protein n=1 Tax=Psychromonas sp. Urea-02u-13 TaxID=2058326 RepID=UPI000C326D9D|nr:hypothetical protein [Psychromonas sp. Urea-02u-13]PKG37116.1 hypothetical protein CXF74_20565 [Psychromonas sp. Urea-02u-13]
MLEKKYPLFFSKSKLESVLDYVGNDSWVEVFKGSDFQIAFQFQKGMGQFISIAKSDCETNKEYIAKSIYGWALVSELWEGAYDEFNRYMKSMVYPKSPVQAEKNKIIDRVLRTLMGKVRKGELPF